MAQARGGRFFYKVGYTLGGNRTRAETLAIAKSGFAGMISKFNIILEKTKKPYKMIPPFSTFCRAVCRGVYRQPYRSPTGTLQEPYRNPTGTLQARKVIDTTTTQKER